MARLRTYGERVHRLNDRVQALLRDWAARRRGRPASTGAGHIDLAQHETIMDRFGVRTKTDAVDLALRHLAGQPMTREEALAMRGAHAIAEVPADEGPVTGK